VPHVSTSIFPGLYKNKGFRSVALVIKRLCTLCIKNFTKNPSNFYLLKVKKNHGDSVKNESARKKKTGGGWVPNAPPSCLRFNEYWFTSSLKIILLKGSTYVTLHNCLVTLELELHNLF